MTAFPDDSISPIILGVVISGMGTIFNVVQIHFQ